MWLVVKDNVVTVRQSFRKRLEDLESKMIDDMTEPLAAHAISVLSPEHGATVFAVYNEVFRRPDFDHEGAPPICETTGKQVFVLVGPSDIVSKVWHAAYKAIEQ